MTIPNIRFKRPLQKSDGRSASVLMIISIDQAHQQKEEFEAFCYGLNQEYDRRHCHELTIIETGYLKRHYLRLDPKYSFEEKADLAAIELGEKWVIQHITSINNLKIPHKILSWKEIMDVQVNQHDKPFSEYLEIVEKDYKKDKAFRNFVDGLTKKYARKLAESFNPVCNPSRDPEIQKELDNRYENASYNYLIEEASIIFKLVHYGFTDQVYPGNANAAVKHIYRKYFGKDNPLPWTEYIIKYPPGDSSTISCNGFFQPSKQDNCEIMVKIKALYSELSSDQRILIIQELREGLNHLNLTNK